MVELLNISHDQEELLKVLLQSFTQRSKQLVHNCSNGNLHPLEEPYLDIASKQKELFALNRDCNLYRIDGQSKLEPVVSVLANVGLSRVTQSGFFLYDPDSYMGWHTNVDEPGTRVYITYSSDGSSFFRYRNNNKVHTCVDKKGITIRKFITTVDNPLWHCVGSSCLRISVGFKIKEI